MSLMILSLDSLDSSRYGQPDQRLVLYPGDGVQPRSRFNRFGI